MSYHHYIRETFPLPPYILLTRFTVKAAPDPEGAVRQQPQVGCASR